MDYKLTHKFQHAKHLKNGTRRSILLYFLNGVKIFEQKLPFDEQSDFGRGKWHYKDEYLLNNSIHQTRWDGDKSRDVRFPVSRKILEQFQIPKDLIINLSK